MRDDSLIDLLEGPLMYVCGSCGGPSRRMETGDHILYFGDGEHGDKSTCGYVREYVHPQGRMSAYYRVWNCGEGRLRRVYVQKVLSPVSARPECGSFSETSEETVD